MINRQHTITEFFTTMQSYSKKKTTKKNTFFIHLCIRLLITQLGTSFQYLHSLTSFIPAVNLRSNPRRSISEWEDLNNYCYPPFRVFLCFDALVVVIEWLSKDEN